MLEVSSHEPVYNLGTNSRFAKELSLVQHSFHSKDSRCSGFCPDFAIVEDACDFDCDIQDLARIADGESAIVLLLSVLEHVIDPNAAIVVIYRILRLGAVAVVSVPFFLPFHGKTIRDTHPVNLCCMDWVPDSSHPVYGDFWRFTHEGLALLFAHAGFARVDVFPIDGWLINRLQILGLYR
jgi:hypothetical protein